MYFIRTLVKNEPVFLLLSNVLTNKEDSWGVQNVIIIGNK